MTFGTTVVQIQTSSDDESGNDTTSAVIREAISEQSKYLRDILNGKFPGQWIG